MNSTGGNSFCTKCGKKLLPESRFCTGCGCAIEPERSEEFPIDNVDAPAKSEKSAGKIVLIIVVSVLGAALLIVGGIIGYKLYKDMMESKAATVSAAVEEVTEEVAEEAFEEPDAEMEDAGTIADSPDEETVSEMVSEEETGSLSSSNITSYETITNLINLAQAYLGDYSTGEFVSYSARYNNYILRKYPTQQKGYDEVIAIDDFIDYMKNTVGYGTVDGLENHDNYSYGPSKDNNYVYLTVSDEGDYSEEVVIDSIQDTSDGKLIVYAHKDYYYGSGEVDKFKTNMRMTLKYNSKSVWDKMQVDSFEDFGTDHYYLPHVQDYVYDLNTLLYDTDWNEFEYHCARNEVFALHGRKFKTPEIQEYFDNQSWYDGYLDDYPIEKLSEVERANINVLDSYKKKKGYK